MKKKSDHHTLKAVNLVIGGNAQARFNCKVKEISGEGGGSSADVSRGQTQEISELNKAL